MAVFRVPNRIELDYQAALQQMLRERAPLMTEQKSMQAWLDEFAELGRQAEVLQIATEIARRMVLNVNIQNARNWREAARKSQRSLMLFRHLESEMRGPIGARLQELVRQNAELITSVPQEIATRLTRQMLKAQQQGVRPETIAKHMREGIPRLTRSRIHLLARTETSKATTALTRARSEGLNLNWFEWLTSEDQRVRKSHKFMAGVLVAWNDLPSPEQLVGEKSQGRYAAGDTYNCRCISSPVLTLDDVRWPHRVYFGGAVHMMSRIQFANLTGMPARVAA